MKHKHTWLAHPQDVTPHTGKPIGQSVRVRCLDVMICPLAGQTLTLSAKEWGELTYLFPKVRTEHAEPTPDKHTK